MRTLFLYSVALCMGLCFSACSTRTPPLSIHMPEAIVPTTDAQNQFIENIKSLSRGMSIDAVRELLGEPSSETPHFLSYFLIEHRYQGGYYISAKLDFDNHGLAGVDIGFGHETRGST